MDQQITKASDADLRLAQAIVDIEQLKAAAEKDVAASAAHGGVKYLVSSGRLQALKQALIILNSGVAKAEPVITPVLGSLCLILTGAFVSWGMIWS